MQQTNIEWSQIDWEDAVKKLDSRESGLTEKDAQQRLDTLGPNTIELGKKASAIEMFLLQFKSRLVIVLIVAAILSAAIGDLLEAIVILAIVIINAALGFSQEFKAEKAIEALQKITSLNAIVIRNSQPHEIESEKIVPGDMVLLQAGNKVPADIRLIEAFNLKADEAILTGESNPVSKDQKTIQGKKSVQDQKNMCFANTVIVYGRAKGLVVNTGMRTEFGKIAKLITQQQPQDTPLKKKLEKLGDTLIKAITAIIALVFAAGVLYGNEPHEMFNVAVSLGVAAIPEGLAAVITITLAIGAIQMAAKNVLVRKMHSIETLGSVTVICSDKTGTITRNEMVVQKVFANNQLFEVTANGYEPTGEFLFEGKKTDPKKQAALSKLLEISAECNDSSLEKTQNRHSIIGDPTEGCLTVLAMKAGITKKLDRADEIPFDADRAMMTTIHDVQGKKTMFTKGAIEKILMASTHILYDNQVKELTAQEKKQILSEQEKLARNAYRILAMAFKETTQKPLAEQDMVFAGFVAMSDPVRDGVQEAVELTKQAGIQVKIITGDNPVTAMAVGEQIGLLGTVMTGEELEQVPQEDFAKTVRATNIFARVSAKQKYQIVTALKEAGEIVAVTGDGVNDAPALKKSDVGVAMGIKGTDVSKEASDIILKDDQFPTIVQAIKEGRRVYANIKNFVKYLLAANIGELMIITIAVLANIPLPLIPLQILWLNIATDSLPALALGTDKEEKNSMKKKPRPPKENVLDNTKAFIIISGIIATMVTFAAFFYGLDYDMKNGATADLKTPTGQDFTSKARTMAFTTLVVFELMFVFSCRGEKGIFEVSPHSNQFLTKMVLVSFFLQVLAVYWPTIAANAAPWLLAEHINFFDTIALSATDWIVVLALGTTSALIPHTTIWAKKLFSRFFSA